MLNMNSYVTKISVLVTLVCSGFFIYQGTNCILKLIKKPKGTTIAIEAASKHGLPTITICPLLIFNESPRMNEMLTNCDLR